MRRENDSWEKSNLQEDAAVNLGSFRSEQTLIRDRLAYLSSQQRLFLKVDDVNSGSVMLGRAFKNGKAERLELKKVVSPTLVRDLTWNAPARQWVRSTMNPRRTKKLEDFYHNVVSCLGSQVPTTRLYGSHLGRLADLGEAAPTHRAVIAFGSNIGDRVGHIERALIEMDRRRLKIKSVSSLYETEPMYVTDQDVFLNGACEVCGTDTGT